MSLFSRSNSGSKNTQNSKSDWKIIDSPAILEEIKEQSKIHKILIFKHSTRCGVSSMALSRLERQWQSTSAEKPQRYFLDLLQYRNLSDEIAFTFKVRHQSPQALLIQDGKCVFHASHSMIDLAHFI